MKSNKKRTFLLYALSSILLASCSSDEDFAPQDNLKDTPITIASAGVADLATSRSIIENKLIGEGATLGLYAENNDDVKYQANHELYTYSGSKWGFTTIDNGDEKQMLFNGTSFNYIIYSPFKIGEQKLCDATSFNVPTDGNYGTEVTTVSGCPYDLLWGNGSSTSAVFSPTLYHTLTMLTVYITELGTEIESSSMDNAVVKIGGTIPAGQLNLTGAKTADEVVKVNNEVASAEITALKLATANKIPGSEKQSVATFEALIIPQTAALKLTIELSDNRVFTATLDSREFSSGKHYNITLRVGRDTVTLYGISASRWESTDGDDLATE